MRYGILVLFAFILMFSSVYALDISLNPSSISGTVNSGEVQTVTVQYSISNNLNTTSTTNINLGNAPNFISSSVSSIQIPANNQISGSFVLTISPSSSIIEGTYNGVIYVGAQSLPVTVVVKKVVVIECQVNPSLVTYTQTVKQGTVFELPKITFNPTNCNGELSITSPYISGGITTNEGQKPVYVKSASQKEIVLGVDTTGLSSETFSTKLTLTAFGKTFSDISNINIIVTGGTSQYTNLTVEHLPSCSVSSTNLLINSTYKIICSSLVPDIEIQPIVDSNYIKGLSVAESENTYEYTFKPKTFGNTKVGVNFLFKNAPIGDPFISDVRIQASSGQLAGTSLALRYYPTLYEAREDENIIIRVIDNQTGNILTNAKVYLDGIERVNSTIVLKSNRNYEIRATHEGYSDLVEQINLEPRNINFTIQDSYNIGGVLNFSTQPEGAVVSLNGDVITLPYTLNSEGTFQIEVSKLGYTTTTKNITVIGNPLVKYSTPQEDAQKNKEIMVEFEKSQKIYVEYKKDQTSESKIIVSEFSGNVVTFKTEKSGNYLIYAEGKLVQSYSISLKVWYKTWWFIGGVLVFVVVVFLLFFKKSSKTEGTNNWVMEG